MAGSATVADRILPTAVPGRRRISARWQPVTLGSLVVPQMRMIALGLVAVLAAACGSSAPQAKATTPAASSTIAPAVERPPLKCHAQAVPNRPRDRTTVEIRVRTVAHAQVTATNPLAPLSGKSVSGRASANGRRTLRLRVHDATPGARIVIDVGVSRDGKKGTCHASFRPRLALPIPAAAPTQPVAAPSPSTAASPPPTTAGSCHPLSNEGTCYEPGEFCRDSDHGTSGVAGDGEKIICEDNNGWRWEPA